MNTHACLAASVLAMATTAAFSNSAAAQVTTIVSVSSSNAQANYDCEDCSISADGRYVAFWSYGSNLVPNDSNGLADIFVHDRQLGTTERVDVSSSGAQANGDTYGVPSISADGRYVAFVSAASDLVPGDTNFSADIFVRDRELSTTERVSVDSLGAQADGDSYRPAISSDGRYVAFLSLATNLVPGDTNGVWDVFVHDRQTGTTERVSVDSSGVQGNANSDVSSISAHGRYVAFASFASNLVPGDTNGSYDVFVRDRVLGTTERVSIDSSGTQGNNWSANPSISADGRYVAFSSNASNLVANDSNSAPDIYIRDRQLGTTERISIDSSGAQGNATSDYPSISADGRYVAFASYATNLVAGDTNGFEDVFVHDRSSTGFTSLCDPGANGVTVCPCSNPPSNPGHGCDNSSATGGASVSASGAAYLSMDSLVFTTSAEKPTATSIVLQGTSLAASGLVFGQGVRCAAGSLKRLYTKNAAGGSITAPQPGDPTVSAQSATLGDPISAGQSRWYLVYYRDPVVLGGCPAASTFNATPTAQISWSL